jgi:hypothetical protein
MTTYSLGSFGTSGGSVVLGGGGSTGEIVGTASFVSTGTEYGAFATLGEVPEGEVWMVTGEILMAADTGAALSGGMVQFRISARRRVGASLNVSTLGVLTNGTGSPAAQHNSTAASSNQLTLEARLSGLGTVTVYQTYRYRVTKIVMP